MMHKPPSSYVIGFIMCALWCVSAGQFFEQRLPFGDNELFWPLWIAVCVIIWLNLLVLDNWWERHKRSN